MRRITELRQASSASCRGNQLRAVPPTKPRGPTSVAGSFAQAAFHLVQYLKAIFGATLDNLSCRMAHGPCGCGAGSEGTSFGASEAASGRKSSPRKSGRTAGLTGAIGVTRHRINSDGRAAAFGANQNSGLAASSSSERTDSPRCASCSFQSSCVGFSNLESGLGP